MKQSLLTVTIAVIMMSCATQKSLHQAGRYTIKERTGTATQFEEVAGMYEVIGDTLKVGDMITINVIKLKARARHSKRILGKPEFDNTLAAKQ